MKLHALFSVILFSGLITWLYFTKKVMLRHLKAYFLGIIAISFPWYSLSFYYTGDPIHPYLSTAFFESLIPGSIEMNLINPEKWSGVRSNIFSLLNPVFLMLTDPRTFSYGWLFGISIFWLYLFILLI